MDEPVIGQLGRPNSKTDQAATIEIVGKLRPREWEEFMACLKECIKRFPGKLQIKQRIHSLKVKRKRKKKAR